MAIVEGIERLFSLTARNRFGKHRFFGSFLLGDSKLGDDDIIVRVDYDKDIVLSGVYSLKHLNGKHFFTRGRYYIPTNPRTEKQTAVRSRFRDSVLAWKNLTENEKTFYNKKAKGKPTSGICIFISEYIHSH